MFESFPSPSPWAVGLAFAIDRFVGEVPAAVHPVVWTGRAAQWLAGHAPRTPHRAALAAGALIALSLPLLAATGGLLGLQLFNAPGSRLAVESLLLSTTFAVRALGDAVLSVNQPLARSDLASARVALRALCSRDPSALGPAEVSAAAIESAAENTSDSVVAPLFYYMLFGLPGALAYRAINTLDATLGYHGPLEYLGKAAARLDDLANLIPARLTAALLCIASLDLAGASQALRVWRRDARVTESPNAGHPMAMMAGLLGVALAKPGAYTLGAGLPSPGTADITRGWAIAARAAGLALVLACLGSALRSM